MALPIAAIKSVTGIGQAGNLGAIGQAGSAGSLNDVLGASGTTATGGSGGFAQVLEGALNNLDTTVGKVDELAQGAATGQVSAAEYVSAATEAQLLVQLTIQVRNRAVDAFNEIMRMQV